MLLKCGRLEQIKKSDVKAALDNNEYTLYLRPKNN